MSVQIAAEIRKLLFLRDMTATQLADQAGMTQPYISRRLTGATKFDVDDLVQIAAALGVEVAALLPRSTSKINEAQSPHRVRVGRTSTARMTNTLAHHPRNQPHGHTPPSPDGQPENVAPVSRPAPRRRPAIQPYRHEGVTA